MSASEIEKANAKIFNLWQCFWNYSVICSHFRKIANKIGFIIIIFGKWRVPSGICLIRFWKLPFAFSIKVLLDQFLFVFLTTFFQVILLQVAFFSKKKKKNQNPLYENIEIEDSDQSWKLLFESMRFRKMGMKIPR